MPSSGDLAEHVLVQVTLGIAAIERQVVQSVHGLGEQVRRGNGEPGVLHVVRVRRALSAQAPQPREYAVGDDLVHVLWRHLGEHRPAQFLGIVLGVDRVLDWLAGPVRLVLLERLKVVKALDEHEVGNLLNHLKRVGDASRPERVPQPVDLAT